MKQDTVKAFVDGAALSVTGTGILTSLMAFFESNAAGIGAMCTVLFGLVYIVFQFLSYRKLTLADANQEEIAALKRQLIGLSDRKNIVNIKRTGNKK